MNRPLDIEKLKIQLKSLIPTHQFHYFETIDSTNRFLKTQEIIEPGTWSFCIAEEQTAGRGRFGKTWLSPKGVNIYCSIRFSPPSLSALSGVSLVCGLSTLSALSTYMPTENLCLKWPNDVLYQHHKISGILIEYQTNALIIGIGINVNSILPLSPIPDKPWGSIYSLTGCLTDRNALLVDLLQMLSVNLEKLWRYGLMHFSDEWKSIDYLINKNIKMSIHGKEYTGFARGITQTGALIFENMNGEIRHLDSGEASLLSFVS